MEFINNVRLSINAERVNPVEQGGTRGFYKNILSSQVENFQDNIAYEPFRLQANGNVHEFR